MVASPNVGCLLRLLKSYHTDFECNSGVSDRLDVENYRWALHFTTMEINSFCSSNVSSQTSEASFICTLNLVFKTGIIIS